MTQATSDLACIILAGGSSSRMGADKRRLRLWGQGGPMLLPYLVSMFATRCAEQIVVLNDPDAWVDLPARLVPDAIPGAGPLAGLVAGLSALRAERALVLACDMPLVRVELVDGLAGYPRTFDAIVPLTLPANDDDSSVRKASHAQGTAALVPEPLLAIYARRCLPVVEAYLAHGHRRMSGLLNHLNVRYVYPEEWQQHDPGGRSFLNLNHPTDLLELDV